MTVSSDLFDLIRSLSKTEKAYFKKNGTLFLREGGNKYLQLFDAIAGQTSYDEHKIRQLFKGEKFIRQISVAKNYLYNRILHTMQLFRHNAASEVYGQLDRSEFLFEKGLYRQAEKQLRIAEKLAIRHELHAALLAIREQKSEQFLKRRDPKGAEWEMGRSRLDIRALSNHSDYLALLAKTQQVYNQFGKTKNRKYLQEFKKIMRNPLLQNESRAITFSGKRRFYDIHAVYNSILGKEERAYHFSKKIISLFDENADKKKYAAIQYAGYLNNTLLYCHFLQRYRESRIYLEKFSGIKPLLSGKYEKARLFEIYTNNFLNLYNSTGLFEKAKKMLPVFIAELPLHAGKLADRDKLLLYGNIANTFFGLGEFKNCLAWINRTRNELPANLRPDLESEMHLLNILVHLELGHTELIPHLVNSYQRFLKSKEMITTPEKYLLAYFRKSRTEDTEAQRIGRMAELRDQLTGYIRSNRNRSSYSPPFFDMVCWLESKIEKREFSEVIRDKKKIFRE